MNENKIKKKNIIKTEEDIAIPFINPNQDDKTLNQLLYYVYDDDFVLMINELSTSILNYHKIISKCFVNMRILLNKMGESPYLSAIEGNCSNLENSFKKFYSNAKVIFRKMKLYRNEKFKDINNSKEFNNLKIKNEEKQNGLTIIINNNNNNNNMNNNNINKNISIGSFSNSPHPKNSHNFFADFNNNKINNNNYEQNENNLLYIEKKILDFSENIINILFTEKNSKLSSLKQKDDFYISKNYVINKNNNTRMNFYEYINDSEKKIIAKINYLIESKNKVFSDIESIIEKSQKEKKEYKNQINTLKIKIENLEKGKDKGKDKGNDIDKLNERIKDLIKINEMKENEIKIEKNKNNEIIEQNNNLNNLLKKKKNEIYKLEEENSDLNNILEEKEKELDENKQKYLNEIKLKEELIESNSKNKKEIEKYKKEINYLSKENEEINSEMNINIKKIELLEENNKKIQEELNKIKKEKDNLIKENKNKEKEIFLLKDNKKEINLEIKNTEKEYQDELDKKDKLINEFNEKYDELNEEYNELSNKNKNLNNELINIKAENEKLIKEMDIKEEEYESIKEKYITLIDKQSINTKILEKNKNKIIELEKEINKKNIKLLERQKEIEQNQEEIDDYSNKINSFQNELNTKNEEIFKLNSEIKNKNDKIEEYKKLITEEKNKNIELENNYNKLKASEQNTNINPPNVIEKINNKLKVNTIETSRTKSANKNLYKNKNKFLIQTNYNSESTTHITNNNLKNNLETEPHINNNSNCNKEELELTPDNYIIVKCTEISSKLRWYLFKKKSSKKKPNSNTNNNAFIFTHLKSYFKNNKSYRNTLNNKTSNNPELFDATYEDFIWKPFKNQKEFARFGELPISETKKNYDTIEDLNKKIKKLEENIIEKEKEYEILYINYNILNQKNKNFEEQDKLFETIDKLKKENTKLNELVIKYKNERNDEVGLSFIDNDLEGSKFLDDKGFEDIFSNLDIKKEIDKKNDLNLTNKTKKINNSINNESEKIGENNKLREININNRLKESINLLMNQVNMDQNARSTFSSILMQLGCSDEDIYRIMGNYRGTISIVGIRDKK